MSEKTIEQPETRGSAATHLLGGDLILFPSQCDCGHLFLERYLFGEPNRNGEIGFCWCGFCRTKRMVRPVHIGLASRGVHDLGDGSFIAVD